MSSHHIVRENQEPALLVLNPTAISQEDLGQLLEWSPTIITAEESVEALSSREIKIDILFAKNAVELPQEHIKLITYQSDFLAEALAYLVDKQYKAVNILGTLQQVPLIFDYADRINMVFLAEQRRIILAKSGYEKWKVQGESIYLYNELQELSVLGLKAITAAEYETTADGFFSLTFTSPKYGLLGENL